MKKGEIQKEEGRRKGRNRGKKKKNSKRIKEIKIQSTKTVHIRKLCLNTVSSGK